MEKENVMKKLTNCKSLYKDFHKHFEQQKS